MYSTSKNILNFFVNLCSTFYTLFCLFVFEKYALYICLFPFGCLQYFWNSNIFILLKIICFVVFGITSLILFFAIPFYIYLPPKFLMKYSLDLVAKSKVISIIFSGMLIVSTYYHFKINPLNLEPFEQYVNIWNISTILSLILILTTIFCKNEISEKRFVFPELKFTLLVALSIICFLLSSTFFKEEIQESPNKSNIIQNTAIQQNTETFVYVTSFGKKYHTENCRYVSGGASPIEIEKAKKAYSPCLVCKPDKE